MKALLINYNHTPKWLLERDDLDYVILDRSDSGDNWLEDFPQERILKTKNVGNVDFDKLSFLAEVYDTLPDVFLWGKTNLFKYVLEDDFNAALKREEFTPLLRPDHKTYSDKGGVVCYYQNGMYHERNDSWYFWQMPSRYRNYNDFALDFQLPTPAYLPFNPGGNFILTRERVRRYSKEYYERMRDTLDHSPLPAEAHCCERSYYTLWK